MEKGTDKKISLTVYIRRFDPEKDAAPREQQYTLQVERGMTVLDGLHMLKQTQDPTLGFRFSCRMGVCGSCGMMINGVPGLACNTQILDVTTTTLTWRRCPISTLSGTSWLISFLCSASLRGFSLTLREVMLKRWKIRPWSISRRHTNWRNSFSSHIVSSVAPAWQDVPQWQPTRSIQGLHRSPRHTDTISIHEMTPAMPAGTSLLQVMAFSTAMMPESVPKYVLKALTRHGPYSYEKRSRCQLLWPPQKTGAQNFTRNR